MRRGKILPKGLKGERGLKVENKATHGERRGTDKDLGKVAPKT